VSCGGAELAFALGFDHGSSTTARSATGAAKKPDWIVVGMRYKGHLSDPTEPAAIRHYRERRLNECRPVLETRFYRLYAARPD
jgi:hypothetical protein